MGVAYRRMSCAAAAVAKHVFIAGSRCGASDFDVLTPFISEIYGQQSAVGSGSAVCTIRVNSAVSRSPCEGLPHLSAPWRKKTFTAVLGLHV